MKNPNLTHVRVGDLVLAGGAETEITAIFDDGAALSDGRNLSEHDFFEDGLLVVPQEAPAAMKAMIEAQPAERVQELVVVRRLSGWDEPQFTVAERAGGFCAPSSAPRRTRRCLSAAMNGRRASRR
jgi:hypothetical protein